MELHPLFSTILRSSGSKAFSHQRLLQWQEYCDIFIRVWTCILVHGRVAAERRPTAQQCKTPHHRQRRVQRLLRVPRAKAQLVASSLPGGQKRIIVAEQRCQVNQRHRSCEPQRWHRHGPVACLLLLPGNTLRFVFLRRIWAPKAGQAIRRRCLSRQRVCTVGRGGQRGTW